MKLIEIQRTYFRNDLPKLKVGDEILITTNILLPFSQREKILKFSGIIMSKNNSNTLNYCFVVLKEMGRLVVKNKYFYHSPSIISIEIKRLQKIKKYRRAKLYYLERKMLEKK